MPGLDDGAEDLDEALAICRDAFADGISVLAATPHVRHDYPTTPEQMEAALAEVQAAVGDTLRLVPGGELDLAELDRPHDELLRFALAGNPGYLLVETPYFGWPLDIGDRLFRLRAAGITPVLAHPERNGEVQYRPELLEPLGGERRARAVDRRRRRRQPGPLFTGVGVRVARARSRASDRQ